MGGDSSGRLAGKTAIVTGGSRGIGEAIATAFVREGARVVIASRREEGLKEAAGRILAKAGAEDGAVIARACHMGRPDEVEALVAWSIDAMGPVDVVVSNAATNPYFGPLLQVEGRAWDKTFEVNIRGSFELARHAAKAMIADGRGGSIIGVSSMLGLRAAPLQGVYAMTKAALISLVQTLAVELGPANIRANAIAPGLVETRFAQALTGNPAILDRYNAHTALGRHAVPDEIAGAAVYLASDESSYVTGQTLCVDGGYTVA